ncbi:MAG TPA: MFS transporter [Ilumatobacteraceae bacterium]|nr:MFS transporter [Ilumatobacteraceae bacterium]
MSTETTAAAPLPPSTTRRPLGPNYRKVFTASVISNLGDGVAQIGYPWLASAITRNPLLIALVAVTQKLPWLLFSLPAGVITDRADRRKLIVRMDALRAVITLVVAVAVLGFSNKLPDTDALESVVGTQTGLYVILVVASLLLGMAEVLRDNSAQTIIPSIVDAENLERANGRMWSAEQIANSFVGPPLGSILIGVAFFLPFALDSLSFAVAAGLVALVAGQFRARSVVSEGEVAAAPNWKVELKEGVRWLWQHPVLRTLAIVLGMLNALSNLETATLVLFAQEVLHTSAFEFAILSMGGVTGAVLGGFTASAISKKLGTGPSLWMTLIATVVTPIPIGLTSWWPLVFAMFALGMFVAVVWNVITVSLRQAIIPDHLLGRVNSVYRFFGWGSIPIGTALGGLTVVLVEPMWGREAALRAPWFLSSALGVLVCIYAIPRLTSQRLDAARAEGIAAKAAEGDTVTP